MSISWRAELEIGVPEIDNQHKGLVEALNSFLTACRNGQGMSELKSILEFLDNYVVQHFNDEEKLQVESCYPEYELHRQQHLDLISRMDCLKKEFNSNSVPDISHILAMNSTLVEWLVKHIAGSDKRLGRYLVSTGYLNRA